MYVFNSVCHIRHNIGSYGIQYGHYGFGRIEVNGEIDFAGIEQYIHHPRMEKKSGLLRRRKKGPDDADRE